MCAQMCLSFVDVMNKKPLMYVSVKLFWSSNTTVPIPVAAPSKAWVCGRSLTGIVGSNLTGGMDVCLL
jgi:hypothetical protein